MTFAEHVLRRTTTTRTVEFGWVLVVGCALAFPTSTRAEDVAEQLAKLKPAERQMLVERKDRFDRLEPAERDRLRKLHAGVTSSPQADQLQSVLQQYTTWLATLPPSQRYELLDIESTSERIEKIREIRMREQTKHFDQLKALGISSEDARRIHDWFQQVVVDNEEPLWAKLRAKRGDTNRDEEPRREDDRGRGPGRPGDPRRRGFLMFELFAKGNIDPLFDIVQARNPTAVNGLVEQLSTTAQEQFRSRQDETARRKLLIDWARAAYMHRFGPTKAELEKFIEDQPQEVRSELERLPSDQANREILQRFFDSKMNNARRRPNGRRPGDGPPDGGHGFGERPFGEGGPPDFRDGPPPLGPDRPDGPPLGPPPGRDDHRRPHDEP